MSVVLLCRFAEILRCDFLTRMRQTTVFVLVFIQMLRLQVITKQTRNIKLINKKKYRGTLGFVVCLFVFLFFFKMVLLLYFKNWDYRAMENETFYCDGLNVDWSTLKHQKLSCLHICWSIRYHRRSRIVSGSYYPIRIARHWKTVVAAN